MSNDEHILLRKLGAGDIDALDMLYLRYAPRVLDFASRFLKNRTEAEDLTQDIFLQVWEHRDQVCHVLSFKGYLFRMTRNAIFNAFKHRQVVLKYQAAGNEESDSTTDDPLNVDDLLAMIDTAVGQMPEQRQRVFRMSRYENMSYNDIAEALEISPRTVQYHISGALSELRKLLNVMVFFIG